MYQSKSWLGHLTLLSFRPPKGRNRRHHKEAFGGSVPTRGWSRDICLARLASWPLGESREVRREQLAKGDASAGSPAINGELASTLIFVWCCSYCSVKFTNSTAAVSNAKRSLRGKKLYILSWCYHTLMRWTKCHHTFLKRQLRSFSVPLNLIYIQRVLVSLKKVFTGQKHHLKNLSTIKISGINLQVSWNSRIAPGQSNDY